MGNGVIGDRSMSGFLRLCPPTNPVTPWYSFTYHSPGISSTWMERAVLIFFVASLALLLVRAGQGRERRKTCSIEIIAVCLVDAESYIQCYMI